MHSLLLSCMDRRLVKPHVEWLTQTGRLGECYLPNPPGGVLELLAEEGNPKRTALLEWLRLAITELHVEEIILMNHTRCGAYAAAGLIFPVQKLERERHLWDMQRAKEFLEKTFPDIKVSVELALIDEQDHVVIEDHPEI